MDGTTVAAEMRAKDTLDNALQEHASARFCLDQFLPYRLNRLTARVSKALAGVYERRFSLSIAQWRILATLQAEPGLSGREVAERASLDKVAVSRAVAALGERGLLQRKPMASDGRVSRLQLSRSGAALFRRIAPLALSWQEDLLAPLSQGERKHLLRLLAKLEANVLAASAGAQAAEQTATERGSAL